MMTLWSKKHELKFLEDSLSSHSKQDIFYKTDDKRCLTYYPKGYKGKKSTIQSRNTLIGKYTENYCRDLLSEIFSETDSFVETGVVCEEIGLNKSSPADIAICTKSGQNQQGKNIKLIIEVKMSLVWNWELKNNNKIICVSDYTNHSATPGILRSDSVLKAIGKSVLIRTSSEKANHIPIIILSNTPIAKSYLEKVDYLKDSGVLQGFWSINPNLKNDDEKNIKSTLGNGFVRFDSAGELGKKIIKTIKTKQSFFSSFVKLKDLGKIISKANELPNELDKAKCFLELLSNKNKGAA